MLFYFLVFSQAITAATWSKSPAIPFHQNPLQEIPLHTAHSNEKSVSLKPSSNSAAAPGARGRNREEIPGGSPLRFCDESRDTDLFTIDYIEVQPFPLYM